MSSQDVIRIPVDNDPQFRAKIIPALVRRHIKEVGPVPHGKGGEPSAAHVIRWGCAEAVNPRHVEELRIERAKVTSLYADIIKLEALMDSAAGKVGDLTVRAEEAEAERDAFKREASRAEEDNEGLSARCVRAEAGLDEERARTNALRAEARNTDLMIRARDAEIERLTSRASSDPVATDGARLKAAREAAGLSQQEMATALHYKDRSAVSLAERGRAPLSASMTKWLKEQGR